MKHFTILFTLLLPLASTAQDDDSNKTPSPESEAYHAYRMKTTTPPYGLAKVQALIAGVSSDEGNSLATKDYVALSLREKFTYHMIHAESYSQNCDPALTVYNEEKKIFGHLPDIFGDGAWGGRQTDFLMENRDSVMEIIKESANRSKRLGLNYKHAIVEINGVEMIPFLVEFYNRDHKDRDILTVLLILMDYVKYPPFMSSPSYAKLYGPNSEYYAFLQANKANEELIIKRAMDLFNSSN
jgi:hypothetical protein